MATVRSRGGAAPPQAQLARFHAGVKRFLNPHRFPVGLEKGLHDLRTRLVLEVRRVPGDA